jgi:hypothetical protein
MAAIAVQQETSEQSRSSESSPNLSRVSSKVEGRRSLGWILAGVGAFAIAGAVVALFALRPDALRGFATAEPYSADRAASSATPMPELSPAQGTVVEPGNEALAPGKDSALPGDPGSAPSPAGGRPGASDASPDAQMPSTNGGPGDAGAPDAQAPSAPAQTGPIQRRPVHGPSGGKPGTNPMYRPPNL